MVNRESNLDIAALNAACYALNLRVLCGDVCVCIAPYGLIALVECTLAEQDVSITPSLRALLHSQARADRRALDCIASACANQNAEAEALFAQVE